MRNLALAIGFLLIASDALAASRHNITNMSCAEVQAILQQEGEAVLQYGSRRLLGLPLYDRYVRGQSFCESGEVAARTGVPTADRKYCPVYRCVESSIFIAR
jgi:hypothetical protein